MKILIVGFQRGGTTLTRRIFHFHPEVQHALHEQRLMKKGNKDVVYDFIKNYKTAKGEHYNIDPEGTWAEKVPWYSNNCNGMIDYCNKFIDMFKKEARIIYVVRHPIDIGLSTQKRWHTNPESVVRMWESFTPKSIDIISKNGQSYIFTFEDLLLNQEEVIIDMFDFCDLDISEELIKELTQPGDKWRYFDRIEPSRAFAYRNKNINIRLNVDYDKLMEDIRKCQ